MNNTSFYLCFCLQRCTWRWWTYINWTVSKWFVSQAV